LARTPRPLILPKKRGSRHRIEVTLNPKALAAVYQRFATRPRTSHKPRGH
jgi:hypothetical protein